MRGRWSQICFCSAVSKFYQMLKEILREVEIVLFYAVGRSKCWRENVVLSVVNSTALCGLSQTHTLKTIMFMSFYYILQISRTKNRNTLFKYILIQKHFKRSRDQSHGSLKLRHMKWCFTHLEHFWSQRVFLFHIHESYKKPLKQHAHATSHFILHDLWYIIPFLSHCYISDITTYNPLKKSTLVGLSEHWVPKYNSAVIYSIF